MTEIIVTRLRPNKILVTSPGPQGPGGGTGEGVQDWFNVRDYGATGNGITDDHAAIMSCITAAGRGGVIYFPRGHYLVSAPVVPLRQQTLLGVYATKYQAGEWPSFYADCAIIAAPGFAGDGVITAAPNSYGAHVEKLAIIGPGHEFSNPNVAGIRFPSRATNQGEMAWLIRDCLINSCPGPGVAGHMWVADFRDTHISNCGWGIRTSDNDGVLDTRIIGCNIYFNRHGGIAFEGGYSGAVSLIGCRVERSGNRYGYPLDPVDPAAPGIRLARMSKMMMTSVDTDSNTGHGLHIGNPDAFVYGFTIVNCQFHRDGSGSQRDFRWMAWRDVGTPEAPTWRFVEVDASEPDATKVTAEPFAAVNLDNADLIRMTGCYTTYGAPDDGGSVGPISPMYGIRINECSDVEITTTGISVLPEENVIRDEGNNSRLALSFPRLQLMTVPVAGEAIHLPTMGGIGNIAYQNDLGTLVVRDYGGNWRAMVSWLPSSEHVRLPRTADLYSTSGEGNTELRIVKGGADAPVGGALLRWTVGTNPEAGGHTFFVGRHGDDGAGNLEAYLDSPLAILRTTGTVETNQLYTRPTTAARAAAQFRGRAGQTGMLTSWEADGGTQVAAVRPDGRIWAQPATASTDLIPLGQLKSVVAASADFADFQSRIAAL